MSDKDGFVGSCWVVAVFIEFGNVTIIVAASEEDMFALCVVKVESICI